MKKITILASLAVLAIACNSNPKEETATQQTEVQEEQKVEASLTMMWETDTILTTNESVLYSPKERVFFVSCIQGQPLGKDGKGFIAKLSTDGTVKDLDWAEGIDAPKGMAIFNGDLYVTNIDELVRIDLESGDIEERYRIAGAQFLNDVVVGDEKVYFSDMTTGSLHVLDAKGARLLGQNIEGLNGLAYADGKLYGLGAAGLLELNKEDGSYKVVNADVTGGDGLVVLDENTFLASRWQGEIWIVQNGVAKKLLDSTDDKIQTADIGYMPEENLVLVPRFFSNKVTAYKLAY